jgi:hypothetical protein
MPLGFAFLPCAVQKAKSGLLNLINDEASFFPSPKPGEPPPLTQSPCVPAAKPIQVYLFEIICGRVRIGRATWHVFTILEIIWLICRLSVRLAQISLA